MSNQIHPTLVPGTLTVIHDNNRSIDDPDPRRQPRYSVVAVHGTGSTSESTWSPFGDKSWLQELLPLHVNQCQVLAYNYALTSGYGISAEDVGIVARCLLDQLSKVTTGPRVVFLGHGLGGIIIKKALGIAIDDREYACLANKTSLLVFFNTPHRVRPTASWESMGNWLGLVSGQESSFWGPMSSAIQANARMLAEVNAKFKTIERIYQVVNVFRGDEQSRTAARKDTTAAWQTLDAYSATMDLPNELNLQRDRSHMEMCRFYSDDDIFEKICAKMNIASGLHEHYAHCLAALSVLFSPEHVQAQERFLPGATAFILPQCRQDAVYRAWSQAHQGLLYVHGKSDQILPSVLSILASDSQPDTDSITFTFNFSDDRQDDEFEMLASLCHQILRLDPLSFGCISGLFRTIVKTGAWRGQKLWVLFRSLLEFPRQGRISCLISRITDSRDRNAATAHQNFMRQIMSLSESQDSVVKFTIISNELPGACQLPFVVDIDRVSSTAQSAGLEWDFLMRDQMSELESRQPGLALLKDEISTFLNDRFRTQLSTGYIAAGVDTARLAMVLLHNSSARNTKLSIRASLDSIPSDLGGVYRALLSSIPIQHNQWAKCCLSWTTRAFRMLGLNELAVALVVTEDGLYSESHFDEELSLDLKSDLERFMSGLVCVEDNQVRLPKLLRTFLLNSHSNDCQAPGDDRDSVAIEDQYLDDSHVAIARKCLSYIAYLQSLSSTSSEASPPPPLGRKYGLLEYAAQYWPLHYNAAGKDEQIRSLDLLVENKGLMQHWADLYENSTVRQSGRSKVLAEPLLLSIELQCFTLTKKLLESFEGDQDQLVPALELAVKMGDTRVVSLLKDIYHVTTPWALHIAASCGHFHLVQAFLEEDKLELKNNDGYMPLHCACESGIVKTVERLIKAGADPAASGATGITPLHIASQFGHLQVMSSLLSMTEVDTDAVDEDGMTALHLACKFQQPGAVRRLLSGEKRPRLETSNNTDRTALHFVAESGRCDVLDIILESCHGSAARETHRLDGKPPMVCNLLGVADKDGMTPLHLAAQCGHGKMVVKLIPLDESLSLPPTSNMPLHLAASKGHVDIVKALTELPNWDKQIKMADHDGSFPIHLAIEGGSIDVIAHIVSLHEKAEFTLDLFDHKLDYATPLHLASNYGNLDVTKALLDAGATPDIADSQDRTPLLLASRNGFCRIALLLLEKGASPTTKDREGISPLSAAVKEGFADIAKILLERLGEANSVIDDDYLTPFNYAATEELARTIWLKALEKSKLEDSHQQKKTLDKFLSRLATKGFTDLMRELLQDESAAPVDITDPSLLQLAAGSGHTAMVKVLLDIPGTSVDGKDNHGRTALSIAAERGYRDIVHLLFDEFAADVNSKDNEARTPLSYAAENGRQIVVEYFLGLNAKLVVPHEKDQLGRSPVWYASGLVDPAVVRALLQHTPYQSSTDTENGRTCYHQAVNSHHASTGSVEVLAELLASEAASDAELPDKAGRTPLFDAAYWGYETAVAMLITKTSVHQPQEDGWKPIHAAYDSPAILKLLLDEDETMVSDQTRLGWTSLHFAVSGNFEPSVKLLLEHNASSIIPNQQGVTSLHIAAREMDSSNLIGLLLPDAKRRCLQSDTKWFQLRDQERFNVIMRAIACGKSEGLRLLLDERALSTMTDPVTSNDFVEMITVLPAENTDEMIFILEDWYRSTPHDTGIDTEQGLRLLSAATDKDNIHICRFLLRSRPGLRSQTDKHGWTLTQITNAFISDQNASGSENLFTTSHDLPNATLSPHGPQFWSEDDKDSHLHFVDEDRRVLEYKGSPGEDEESPDAASARADEPIYPDQSFYFEIEILTAIENQIVAIGFGVKSSPVKNAMPGWRELTWGLHGDDGGLFHPTGRGMSYSEDRLFGNTNANDIVGCGINPLERTAYFTRNGALLPDCQFEGLTGRLFPMVGVRSKGTRVRVNFGGQPFKFNHLTMTKDSANDD